MQHSFVLGLALLIYSCSASRRPFSFDLNEPCPYDEFDSEDVQYSHTYDSTYQGSANQPSASAHWTSSDVGHQHDHVFASQTYDLMSNAEEQDSNQDMSLTLGSEIEEDAQRASQREQARAKFYEIAHYLGCDLTISTLWKRFKDFSTQALIEDLLSEDRNRQYRATGSLLMHRIPRTSAYDEFPHGQFPESSIWNQLTKEEIIERMFEIMGIAPTEDVRTWWYNYICSPGPANTFPNLFSEDYQNQEAAIKYLTGLVREGNFWVKPKRTRFITSRKLS